MAEVGASPPTPSPEPEGSAPSGQVDAGVGDDNVNVKFDSIRHDIQYGEDLGTSQDASDGDSSNPPPVYVTSRELGVNSKYTCQDLPGAADDQWAVMGCGIGNFACTAQDLGAPEGEGYVASESVRIDTRVDEESLLGFDCTTRGGGVPAEGVEPVVITVTLSDFESMKVEPLVASAGPEDGWLPVNMVNVLYAEAEPQTLETEVLSVPVSVRAAPVSYHWDLGDGNTISTTEAGEPFPSEKVSATYKYEGWYDVTLTTTFSGQFSVDGGPWQGIDGTIEVASDPIPIYSKSLESRLVDGDVPVDEEGDPWVPERTAETEGEKDPEATHREI